MCFSCRQCYSWGTQPCSELIISSICFDPGEISLHEFVMMSRFYFIFGWGRERWPWKKTICNIFIGFSYDKMLLVFAFFPSSKGSIIHKKKKAAKVAFRWEFSCTYYDFCLPNLYIFMLFLIQDWEICGGNLSPIKMS